MECMELLYLTSPELGFLEKGCAILQGDVPEEVPEAGKERHLIAGRTSLQSLMPSRTPRGTSWST